MSLLLFVATVVLLVRSYWIGEFFEKGEVGPPVEVNASSYDVKIVIAKGVLFFHRFDILIYKTVPGLFDGQAGGYTELKHLEAGQLFDDTVRGWMFHPTAGFGFKYDAPPDKYGKQSTLEVAVPLWLLAIGFAVLPICQARSWYRAIKRHATNGCTRCGYNLTGNTSGVCPECGAKVPATSLAPDR